MAGSASPSVVFRLWISVLIGLLLASEVRGAEPASIVSGAPRLDYVGAYFADGHYRTGALKSSWAQQLVKKQPAGAADEAEVPSFVYRHPFEMPVENVASGRHAQKRSRRRSALAEWRDDLITAVYGHEQSLVAPQQVVTDSHGRVIVSDPAARAVHVLGQKVAFRITTGDGYRLRTPGAVTTDNQDNIYVADPEADVVAEFDSAGRFIREIGRLSDDEGMFHRPIAIATDGGNRLYVLDGGRGALLAVDAKGHIERRAGGPRNDSGIEFSTPTALATKGDKIVVVDHGGERVVVLDLEFHELCWFLTGSPLPMATVDLDSAGNIYLTDRSSARVRIFGPYGQSRGQFGDHGDQRGQIISAAGLHIDAQDRLYLVDDGARRINVLQIQLPGASGTEGAF